MFIAPTFLAAATQATAIRSGMYGASGKRVLLVTNNAVIPEIAPSIADSAGFPALSAEFDQVLLLNDLIWPKHPRGWRFREDEAKGFIDRLTSLTGLPSEVGVTVQSLGVAPSRTVARILEDSPITVISDGLMSYGPVRSRLTDDISRRLTRLIYLDLIPGLRPQLFAEYGVELVPVPKEPFVEIVSAYLELLPERSKLVGFGGADTAMVLGQYLSALGLMSTEEEVELYREMALAAADLGYRRIIFKPHPSAPPSFTDAITSVATERGVVVEIERLGVPVEAIFAVAKPGIVLGVFSTALATARSLYGIDTATLGATDLARKLPHYVNSNRVPLALTALTTPQIVCETGMPAHIAEPVAADIRLVAQALSATMQPLQYSAEAVVEARAFAQASQKNPELAPYFEGFEEGIANHIKLVAKRTPRTRAGRVKAQAVRMLLRARKVFQTKLRPLLRRGLRQLRFTWYAATVKIPRKSS